MTSFAPLNEELVAPLNCGARTHKRMAWDAVVSPKLENWPLFGQKFSIFGQIMQLHSHLIEVMLMLPSAAKALLRLFCHFFASDGKIDTALRQNSHCY